MTVRDYMASSPGMRETAAQKTGVRIAQKPDTTQQTSEKQTAFTKSHNPDNVNIAK